jgi:hypothetical protein
MDPIQLKAAADELTNKALPELIAAGNALVDRLEKLLSRLSGATLVLTIPPEKP